MDAIWRDVYALMWDAYFAGTIPVGAVVADERGEIVARGRNRIFDASAPGHLGRSRLAHAELNALAQLSSERRYEDWTLHTALEPCHLCLCATIAVRVGSLRYAAPDPYAGGVGKLLPSEDHRAHPVRVEGPLDDPLGRLPELLHVAHMLWRVPGGGVATFYRRTRPEVVALAQLVPAPDSGATADDVLGLVAPHL